MALQLICPAPVPFHGSDSEALLAWPSKERTWSFLHLHAHLGWASSCEFHRWDQGHWQLLHDYQNQHHTRMTSAHREVEISRHEEFVQVQQSVLFDVYSPDLLLSPGFCV